MAQAGKTSGAPSINGPHTPNMGQEDLLLFALNAVVVVFGCQNSKCVVTLSTTEYVMPRTCMGLENVLTRISFAKANVHLQSVILYLFGAPGLIIPVQGQGWTDGWKEDTDGVLDARKGSAGGSVVMESGATSQIRRGSAREIQIAQPWISRPGCKNAYPNVNLMLFVTTITKNIPAEMDGITDAKMVTVGANAAWESYNIIGAGWRTKMTIG